MALVLLVSHGTLVSMALLIGMDEAGYGPNLGPLVIAATAWRIDPSLSRPRRHPGASWHNPAWLYDLLAQRVTCRPSPDGRVAITDSKKLYKGGGRLEPLERGVLAAFNSIGRHPNTWRQMVDLLAADPEGAMDRMPWYQGRDFPIPVDGPSVAQRITGPEPSVSIVALRARAIFAEEFNAQIELRDNKADVLTGMSLGLLDDLLDGLKPCMSSAQTGTDSGTDICVICDKHGGRNRYGPAFKFQFPNCLVEVCDEGRQESRYLVQCEHAQMDIRFIQGGESFLPTALASMIAKYFRELAMRLLNAYWQRQVPGLPPTAGYPVDAKRFKQAIESRQKELNIDDRVLWRMR